MLFINYKRAISFPARCCTACKCTCSAATAMAHGSVMRPLVSQQSLHLFGKSPTNLSFNLRVTKL